MNARDPRLLPLQRYADGLATAEDMASLERALRDDAEFRRLAIEYLHVDSALEKFAGAASGSKVVAFPRRSALLALAAAVLAIVGGALWFRGAHDERIEVEVLEVADASNGWRAGQRVKMDTLALHRGSARVRLASDVQIAVSAPVELRILSPMHAQVVRGKVTVDVGARGQGFILDTPTTRVVDLGTQFGVEVRPDRETDVMVFQGKVELYDQAARVAQLDEGEAVRVGTNRRLARIQNVVSSGKFGEWSTSPPPPECSIAAVSDNITEGEASFFYRIVPGGLRSGAVAYVNRPQAWRAAEGREFPASLAGADYVQTFRAARKIQRLELRVTLSRPATLSILMPKRETQPDWLTRDFIRTEEVVALAASEQRKGAALPVEVWQRSVASAGVVTLGPVNPGAEDAQIPMYAIAARPLSTP